MSLGITGIALLCAAAAVAEPVKETTPTPTSVVGLGTPAVNAPGGLAGAAEAPAHLIELAGYVILKGSWIQEDPAVYAVGHNNGFALGDARIELTGHPIEQVWLYLSIDGAVPLRDGPNGVSGRRTVDLKDAYGVYSPGYHLRVQAGQFKAPQDVEELMEETELRFPNRSIVSDGQHPPNGYDANGLALGRQLGIALGTDSIPLPFGSSFETQIAILNGNGANQLVNDTQLPSVSGRAALKATRYLQLGFDAYYQPRGSGTQPNYFRDDLSGFGGDLTLDIKFFHALALIQKRNTHHLNSGAQDESATGYSLEAAARWWFLEPAIRYAYLDPNSTVPNLPVTETTFALNLYSRAAAARLSIAYTARSQQPARTLRNNGLDVSAQVRF